MLLLLCREIIDNTSKENGIDIIMADRTFHLIAESPEDARWGTAADRLQATSSLPPRPGCRPAGSEKIVLDSLVGLSC